jgi:dihydrolipoamide dehydrogenase
MGKLSLTCRTDEYTAAELYAAARLTSKFAASSEDIARIVHAHLSLSEVLHEAALRVDKRAVHI